MHLDENQHFLWNGNIIKIISKNNEKRKIPWKWNVWIWFIHSIFRQIDMLDTSLHHFIEITQMYMLALSIFDKNFVKSFLLFFYKNSVKSIHHMYVWIGFTNFFNWYLYRSLWNTVWKLWNFTATIFSQKFRESNFLLKNFTTLIWRKKLYGWEFLVFPHCVEITEINCHPTIGTFLSQKFR